ncbi:MAG: CoB--CoM heterodisulfide reductase iron-sulfur subunit B family protein [Clostridia bacterium]|nr:CoB--CoM heterodisulfide reductase iron-sulfur subunit B family protein [Clostridia bacterium]
MKIAYYPGCTLKNRARDLDRYARETASALGCEFEEIPLWQCCGGAYTSAKDEIATKLAAVRALAAGRDMGGRVVTVCSACFNVLAQTNREFLNNPDFDFKVNNYLKGDPAYHGEASVVHYLTLLRDEIGFDAVKARVTKPLKGKKIAAYYGCLLLRPSEALAFDDPENPSVMEDFIRALGAEPVNYSMRNECCGGYLTLEDREAAKKRSNAVVRSAAEVGADFMITACPLCMYNLTKNADEKIPVRYFTDVLAEAFGLKEGAAE